VPRNSGRSQASLAAEACISVLRECGLTARDVDGLCGTFPSAAFMQATLGIPEVTWFANPFIPFGNHVAAAAAAVHSGLCEVVLAYHGAYRLPWNTLSSLKDPFRRSPAMAFGTGGPGPENINGALGYTAWASRYVHEHGVAREAFGRVAINDRTNACLNPAAAMREPMTMEDYLAARMIREPLCLLDMDVPVDGGDAFVITTAERARDLPLTPVLINAVALGMTDKNDEDQTPDLGHHGQQVVVEALKAKSDFWIEDCDVYFPYDGFTPITLAWIENTGWCKPGEAGDFLAQHWSDDIDSAGSQAPGAGRVLVDGRIPFNPHGGALSEGGTQGSGHVREAIHQLQGLAGERQVADAQRAVLTLGGFFFNAQGVTLRRDG
jgi:acetyl-CoA acetyltransferase